MVSGGAIGGDGFSIGQVLEAQTGAVSFVFPWQGAPTSVLLPTQTGAGAEFGFRIAAAQFVLAVSEARRGVMPAVSSGVVKVYERAGMTWTLSFTGSSPYQPSMEHQFGHSLAIQQDTLFVGAPGYLAGRGVIYIYERTPSWTWPTYPDGSVFAYDGTSFDEFGSSMAVEGDWLAIGAPKMERDQGVAESEGAVYVFRRIDGAFVQVQRLMAPSPQGQSNFGHALAMHESVLVVGAPAEDDPNGGTDAGAVYLFALDDDRWIHQQRLVSSEAAPFDRFGSSVAVRGRQWLRLRAEPITSTAPTLGLLSHSSALALSGSRPAGSPRPSRPLP